MPGSLTGSSPDANAVYHRSSSRKVPSHAFASVIEWSVRSATNPCPFPWTSTRSATPAVASHGSPAIFASASGSSSRTTSPGSCSGETASSASGALPRTRARSTGCTVHK
ncbi:hypothetical protein [Amycolatopsis nalaikhensis]|uniref:Uncharacterized protein n=1 Tax=Amycolatopsis nalaikhensis TaxID=715472 RepID=A0ABY8XGH4_9PSEU|nr:hypothetical protein [Amycolatopsis sp. 2-2]WIV54703.1 hypothetical protein QP939_38580 [Amycolatopsis sp. 2-2]